MAAAKCTNRDFNFSEQALALCAAMTYPPESARLYIERGWWLDDTLSKWLDRHATGTPDAPAIRDGDTVISYGELHRKVRNLSDAQDHQEQAEAGIALNC